MHWNTQLLIFLLLFSLIGLILQGNLLMAIDFVSRHRDCFFDIVLLSTVSNWLFNKIFLYTAILKTQITLANYPLMQQSNQLPLSTFKFVLIRWNHVANWLFMYDKMNSLGMWINFMLSLSLCYCKYKGVTCTFSKNCYNGLLKNLMNEVKRIYLGNSEEL